jgi:hypothetical protein
MSTKKKKTPLNAKPLPWLLTPEEWVRFSRDPESFRGKVTCYLQDTIIPTTTYSIDEMKAWCETPTRGSRGSS